MAKPKKDSAYRIPETANASSLLEEAQEAFFKDPNVIAVRIGFSLVQLSN